MTKNEIKSLISLKQSDIPFNVKNRTYKLPLDGGMIVTIPGVRRCGKSTAMEIAINGLIERGIPKENILWIGFDDERFAQFTSSELNLILDAYREMFPNTSLKDVWMFFDELPLIEGWELFVLRVYKNYCKNIFVCGSNAHMLSKDMKTELRGWPIEYETYPLSFNEYCHFLGINSKSNLESEEAKIRNAFDSYNRLGGMPEVALTENLSLKYKRLQGYFDTMLLKDFIEHFNVKNPLVLRFFLKRVMSGISNPVSVNSIYGAIKSQGLKIARDELYIWLQNACDIYLFVRVPKFSRSLTKQENSLSKYYVIDNGLRNAILPMQSDDDGKQLENTIFLELLRRKKGMESITFYQGKGECDFVISVEENVQSLIQVTWSMNRDDEVGNATRHREISGIIEAAKALNCSNLTIITYDEDGSIDLDGFHITIISAWRWLLLG
ncbi:MAG: ATP-binding protein [Kiritimatiellae bacterium]|nr:ATP-binding protein [Kiritimatiellia bacterium]